MERLCVMSRPNTSKKAVSTPQTQRFSLYNSAANYFVLLIFILLPLFVNITVNGSFPFLHFENGYYGIRHQKYYLFIALAAFAAVGEVLVLFTEGIAQTRDKYDLTSRDKIMKKISVTDWAVLALLVVCAISTVFSANREMSFFGEYKGHGRNNGLLLMLMYVLGYFIVSRAFRFREHIFIALSVTASAVYLLAVLNCFNIDPLGMFVKMKGDEVVMRDFLTTIGNKNMFSTYICVTLPAAAGLAVYTEKLACRAVYLVTVALGSIAMIVCDSDSAVLGTAAFAAVLLIAHVRFISRLKRLFLVFTIMLASSKALYLISQATGNSHKELSALPYKMMLSPVTYALLVIVAVITAALYLLDAKKPGATLPKAVPVALAAVFAAGVAAVLGAVIYFTNVDTKTDLGSMERLLRFNEAWGTHRGVMWIDSIKVFGDSSIFEKLFGAGPEMFYYKFEPYFKDLYRFGDGSTDAAHNEYIQYLINIGILGLSAYLTFVGSALYRAFKAIKKQPQAIVFIAAVSAYLAQAVVNIALPIGTPLFMVFVALCENAARQASEA